MKKYLISGFNTVQDVKLEVGTYTLVAYVKSMHGDVYTFALGDGTDWEEFSIDVIQGQLCKVWLTFTIDKKATKFKPIANNFTEELPVYVADLQLTRGNIPVESGASPFDIDQILNDLHDEINAIEDFTEGAFLDGLLSREEKTQLRASLDAVGAIVESVKGSYDKLLDNPFIHENTMDSITARYYAFIASWISDGDPRGLKPVILWIVNGDNIVDQNERDEKDRALNAFNLALYEYNQAEKEVYNNVGEEIDTTISKVDVEYALGEFLTVAPTNGWTTSAPEWQENMYMWSRIATYKKGAPDTPIYSNETCIAGARGIGIKSITEWYYHSTSATELKGGGWSTDAPISVPDKYIWTKSIIEYTDDDVPDKETTPIMASGFKGADAIAPIIDENGMWAFWSTELQEFIPSEFSAEGDDGHSPYIDVLTGTWWEWSPELGKYKDTLIKAEGEDGKDGTDGKDGEDGTDGKDGLPPEIDTTTTQYALGESKTEHPAEEGQVWAPPRIIDGQIVPAGYIDIWKDDRKHLVPNEATPYEWSRQKITYKNSTQVIYVGYVLITNISPMTYFFGEWDMRVAYTRNDKSYPIVTYKRGTNNRPLYYYPKKESVIKYMQFVKPNVNSSSTWYKKDNLVWYENDGSNGDPVCPLGIFKSKYNDNKYLPTTSSWWDNVTAAYAPNGDEGQKLWEFADGMELIITEAIMANFAKLDSFVFHKGKMFSQEGTLGGVAGSVDYTNEDHEPNFEVDGFSGKVKMKDAEISGKVNADEGSIGVLNVNKSGQVSVLDPSSNAERFIINADNLPALSSLINGTNTSGSVNNNPRWGETSVYTFPTKLVVPKNGSNIRIQTSLGLTMMGGSQGELAGSAYASLELRKTGMTNLTIGQVMLDAKAGTINEQTIPIDRTFTGMSSGTYSLVLRVVKVGDVSSAEGRTTSSTLSYTHQVQGVSRVQIGLDGLMMFYTQNHFHFSATQGLKIGGDVSIEGNTNMNGVLLAVDKRVGSFSNTTSFNQKWGIARLTNVSMSRVGNVVKLYHYLGHTDYFVTGNINAGTSGLENIKTYANYCEVTMAGNIGDNHNIQLMLIGQNK